MVRRGALGRAEALAAIGEALEFPDWYGHNLDALYDCLTDLSWLPEGEHVLVWERGGDPAVRAVLEEARHRLAEVAAKRTLTVADR
ncbi:barstar family protein [Saccharothrix coeruleofusca]|uniref:barstar family protein n=1 Tax=Saccharothrix coeruleofusca TaxID=33919 RepID=UPI001E372F2F|nr:barstar family protein [Saccharothrix coeruleofusca]